MKKISEVETIYNAFKDTALGKLPKNEKDWPEWYRDRMDKCESCIFNTKNIPSKMMPTNRLYFSKIVGKYCCSICGCYIPQKAWSRTEVCSLGEKHEIPSWMPEGYLETDRNREPRWNRLDLLTMKADEFNVLSTDGNRYNIDLSEDGNEFVFELAPTRFGDATEFSFILECRHNIQITGVTAGCQCTIPNLNFVDPKHIEVSVFITTQEWGVGFAEKPLTLSYQLPGAAKGSPDEKVNFNFKIHISTSGMRKDEIEAVEKRNKELNELRKKEAEERARKEAEREAAQKAVEEVVEPLNDNGDGGGEQKTGAEEELPEGGQA